MSYFIELTRPSGERVTFNTDHIATFHSKVAGARYEGDPAGRVVTEIMLGSGILPAFAHISVIESYEEVGGLIAAANAVSWEVSS